MTMTVEQRRDIEKKIITRTLDTLIKAGYEISVFNGEEIVISRSINPEAILDRMFSVDDEQILLYKPDERKRQGWVQFIYGNDGWDVIADHSGHLDEVLKPVSEYANEFSDNWPS